MADDRRLQVELVAADRTVWTGEADMVIARTADGDVGILVDHAPLLGTLADGAVLVRRDGAEPVAAVVHGGFLSVADNQVAVLAELAELASEIDPERARQALSRAEQMLHDDAEALDASQRAMARLRAHGDAF